MITGQTRLQPGSVLDALESLVHPPPRRLRFAVAYVTRAGVDLLLDRLIGVLGEEAWAASEKALISCFDFGITEPAGLTKLMASGFGISIAHVEVLDTPGLRPTSAYHPKLYIAESITGISLIVGSANLTDRALTSNSEAVAVLETGTADAGRVMRNTWDTFAEEAVELSAELMARYQEARRGLQIPRPARRPRAPDQPSEAAEDLEEPLTEAVLEQPLVGTLAARLDRLDPEEYDHFWVQTEALSGGSHNQLELPRHGSQFFGFHHVSYGAEGEPIGEVTLAGAAGQSWEGRRMRWHGDNGMERINLPTQAQGGYEYENSAVLFTRQSGEFKIDIALWASPLAVSWRQASERLVLVFRLGDRTERLCGLF